jgi:hypothetical protein
VKPIALAVALLVSLAAGSIAPVAQTPESQPMTKPLSPELERVIQAMPPSARDAVRHMLETDPAMRRKAELGETLIAQKRPHWTRETVLRKIRAVFPGSDPAQIMGTLENGGAEGNRAFSWRSSSSAMKARAFQSLPTM